MLFFFASLILSGVILFLSVIINQLIAFKSDQIHKKRASTGLTLEMILDLYSIGLLGIVLTPQ
ncbi:hypothetical protein C3Y93_04375 [Acinetobacter sp. SWBY1]|jgi:hypothetical protein|nr:hypothetical protein C3Y93_04375 [Acinetobacter sp. SWBY1]